MQVSFESHLRSTFNKDEVIIASQVDGLFGVPDVVLIEHPQGGTGHIVAMELKLSSWRRRALVQAFRYRSFAWESYVVLDASRAPHAAISQLDEFRKRNIGLATYSCCCEFVIYCRPRIQQPYSANISEKVASLFHQDAIDGHLNKKRPSRIDGLGKVFSETLGKRVAIRSTA